MPPIDPDFIFDAVFSDETSPDSDAVFSDETSSNAAANAAAVEDENSVEQRSEQTENSVEPSTNTDPVVVPTEVAEPATKLDRLAVMTGYADATNVQPAATANSASNAETATHDESALLDEEDIEDLPTSKRPLWTNPYAKGLLVAGIIGAGLGFVGLFLMSVHGGPSQTEVAAQPSPDPTPVVDPAQAEIGTLKTKVALGTQTAALQQQKADAAKATPNVTGNIKSVSIPPTPTAPIHPATLVTTAAPYISRPSYVDRPPAAPIYRAPTPVSAAAPRETTAALPQIDPTQAWQNALSAGSYGQVQMVSSNTTTPSIPSSAPSNSPAIAEASAVSSPGTPDLSSQQQMRYDADTNAIMTGVPSALVNVLPGTTATATLSTPVVWAQALTPDQQPQRFGLTLTQPIVGADGTTALPAGTPLIAQVDTVSGSGLVQLSIVGAVVSTSSGKQLISIPTDALMVSAEGGKPLIASNYHHNSGSPLLQDAETAVIGALGQLGTLLNRPSNQSTVTTPYVSTTSVSNNQTNVLGGLLQGGFGALSQALTQQQQQQQQAQQQQMQSVTGQSNVWYVPSGKTLQVSANSSFEVNPG